MEINELKKSWWVISDGLKKYKSHHLTFEGAVEEARAQAERHPTMLFNIAESIGAFKAKVIDTEMEQFTFVD